MTAILHRPSRTALRRLAGVLRRGGLVAVPTETVYGLAANALDTQACERIFAAKDRPAEDPLIVHVASVTAAATVAELTPAARELARAFWPGPLTMVLPKKRVVPAIVTAGLDSVAVRVPRHPVFRDLLRECGLPLAAPSANPFGYVSPTRPEHVQRGLGDRIEHILDGGPCEVGLESTIVDLRNPARPCVLRPGAISAEAIAQVLGVAVTARRARVLPGARRSGKKTGKAQRAPGLLARHYSPGTRLRLVARIEPAEVLAAGRRVAYLFLSRPKDPRLAALGNRVAWLSEAGDPAEAGRNVYSRLRTLDEGGYREIIAERVPGESAFAALADRLGRAAARGR
jgi:L-threonylcarbamoyladenylate synthase